MHGLRGCLLPTLILLFVSCQSALAENRDGDPALLEVGAVQVDDRQFRVTIADPFIEMHTGPSAGYPIFHVVERGTEVRVIRRKTSWFKLETDDGKVGWASREQMRQTLLPSGEKFKLVEQGVEDFSQRKWVLGITGGEFEKSPVFTFFTGYAFTENLAGELHIGQSVGSRSSSAFYKGNLVMQPLPEFRFSPYLTLGMGRIEVTPSTTLVAANAETNTFAQFGLGLQTYISRSFLLRFEVNEYVIFSTTSTSNNNEEVEEWKFGFAVFF